MTDFETFYLTFTYTYICKKADILLTKYLVSNGP